MDRDRRYMPTTSVHELYDNRDEALLTSPHMHRRDIPPEDQYGSGRGQSYRPRGVTERPPTSRTDGYRPRSPESRRNEFAGDTYRRRSRTPPRRDDFRRRSPSPRFRDRDVRGATAGDSYRARSPPRKREDDLIRREPPPRDSRDFRDERSYRDDREYRNEREYGNERDRGYAAAPSAARSPPPRYARDRSPIPPKRGREPSPLGSRDRRTPPVKRERLDSPPARGRYDDYPPSRPQSPPRRRYSPERRPASRGAYRARSRSPMARSDRVDPRAVDDWRKPRSPSPRYARQYDLMQDENGRDSNTTSHRSTPHVHPSRMQQVEDLDRPALRDRDYGEPEPTPMELEYSQDRGYADDRIPPPREPYRADDALPVRAPPTGPSGYRAPSSTMAPPTGPAAAPVSVSAHSRPAAAPPSGPRAGGPPRGDFGAPRGRGGFRGDFGGRGDFRGRGGFGGVSYRGGRGDSTGGFAGRGGHPTGPGSLSRHESYEREAEYGNGAASNGPPSGPRGSFSQSSTPAFRSSNNATATTYPRSQRFGPGGQAIPESTTTPTGPRAARRPTEPALESRRSSSGPQIHPALADLPKAIEGGQKLEPVIDRSRLDKLQEEAEKLRKAIDEKEAKKRKNLREWDRLSRETEAAALRTQLAGESLRGASGEAEASAAF